MTERLARIEERLARIEERIAGLEDAVGSERFAVNRQRLDLIDRLQAPPVTPSDPLRMPDGRLLQPATADEPSGNSNEEAP